VKQVGASAGGGARYRPVPLGHWLMSFLFLDAVQAKGDSPGGHLPLLAVAQHAGP